MQPALVAPLGFAQQHALRPEALDWGFYRRALCAELSAEETTQCWANLMARHMPAQYICNVSALPEANTPYHPALDARHLADFRLPPGTHLFLYGSSHVRSARHVLVSAARLQGAQVNSTYISVSDDCDEHPEGLSYTMRPKGFTATCGIFQEDGECTDSDLVRDWFPETGSSITTISNHRQYLVPEHTRALATLLKTANPQFTHGYITHPHLAKYFEAHCDWRRGGPKPDPAKVGDSTEFFCDVAQPNCMSTSILHRVVKQYIPNVGFLGGVAFKHANGVNSSSSRIHEKYERLMVAEGGAHVHACNAVCEVGQTSGARLSASGKIRYADFTCQLGEGVAVAWEVLRSAGVLNKSCSHWQPEFEGCDPLEFRRAWELRSHPRCEAGSRNPFEHECLEAARVAAGLSDDDDGDVAFGVIDSGLESKFPAGCSYNPLTKCATYNVNRVHHGGINVNSTANQLVCRSSDARMSEVRCTSSTCVPSPLTEREDERENERTG